MEDLKIKKEKFTINYIPIIIILILLTLIGGFYLYIFHEMKQLGNSITESIKKPAEHKITDEKSLPEFLTDNQHHLYIGVTNINGIKKVNNIHLKSVNSSSIKYKIEFLENWRLVNTIEGIAKLDLETVKADNYLIQDENSKSVSAYKLTDYNRKCKIIIGITKNKYSTSTKARVFEDCGNDNIMQLTPLLYYK